MTNLVLNHAATRDASAKRTFFARLIHDWPARRAVVMLDAHLLCDLGLTRADVRWAADLPLTADAAQALDE